MREDLLYWISLSKIKSLSRTKIRNIIQIFPNMKEFWFSDVTTLKDTGILTSEDINSICLARENIEPEKELEEIKKRKINVITIYDSEYPQLLKEIYDPPFLLYCKGNLEVLKNKSISIVGTRNCTNYGKEVTRHLAHDLSSIGITIVSGLALGIDTAAHIGALIPKNGTTIAVLGSGIDFIYPRQNRNLYEEISQRGLIISEYPPDTKPEVWRFPARNRIISGLSYGVIVVEASEKSGALITADYALDQGREVFAVPGQINREQSKGVHNLIRQGATLITCVSDVFQELGWFIPELLDDNKEKVNSCIKDLTKEEQQVYLLLNSDPKHIDFITSNIELSSEKVNSILMLLEIKGLITQLDGKRFIRK